MPAVVILKIVPSVARATNQSCSVKVSVASLYQRTHPHTIDIAQTVFERVQDRRRAIGGNLGDKCAGVLRVVRTIVVDGVKP